MNLLSRFPSLMDDRVSFLEGERMEPSSPLLNLLSRFPSLMDDRVSFLEGERMEEEDMEERMLQQVSPE